MTVISPCGHGMCTLYGKGTCIWGSSGGLRTAFMRGWTAGAAGRAEDYAVESWWPACDKAAAHEGFLRGSLDLAAAENKAKTLGASQ